MKSLIYLFFAFLAFITSAFADTGQAQKAVLVTGAGTGIGRKITERLAAAGYFVYAGTLKDADLQALSALKNVRGIHLDVTSPQDIAAAVELVTHEGRGLYGLVNNAGVFSEATVADTKPQEFDLIMAVNVAGPFRITQAFLPLIIAQKGRILTTGSLSGLWSDPEISVYCMSKHAIEAFTDSLAQEMEPFGVKVSVLEPGEYKSSILDAAVARGKLDRKEAERRKSKEKEPDDVAAAAMTALSERDPKRRYLVVPQEGLAEYAMLTQIRRLVQSNEGQPYTYDRETLIKMLDDALAHARPKTTGY